MSIILDPNLQLSPVDPRDYIAKLPATATPPSVDLKPLIDSVENQYMYGSCTANAGTSALELMFNLQGYKLDLSRMFLYYYSKELSGLPGDFGAYPRSIGEALLKYGTCYESTWDYREEHLLAVPSDTAIAEAEHFKILSYAQITGDVLPQIKASVAQNIPVLLTMEVHPEFSNLSGSWKTHNWNYVTSQSNQLQGLHEVLVIGYDDASQRLLIENSWGPAWGDGGFFGLPYNAVATIVPELWVLTTNPATITYLENNPPPPIVPDPVIDVPVNPVVPVNPILKKFTPLQLFIGVAIVAVLALLILTNI